MGIEPIRTAPQNLENAAFRDAMTAACDWRANFRVMRDNVGLREATPHLLSNFRCRPPTICVHAVLLIVARAPDVWHGPPVALASDETRRHFALYYLCRRRHLRCDGFCHPLPEIHDVIGRHFCQFLTHACLERKGLVPQGARASQCDDIKYQPRTGISYLPAPNVPLTFSDTASRNGRPTRSGCSR
jgi:hypothetical protein